jgi:membrane fusion protein, copper/silver efflux system
MWKPQNLFFLILVIAGSFVAGTWYSKHSSNANVAAAGRKILYYHDPMHPAYKSDRPGIAPDCGMQLEPVYANDIGSNESSEQSVSLLPGSLKISADRQQLIGLKVATVEKISGSKSIRIPGRVVPDETRVFRINSAVDGWVKEICPITTGSLVRKDELLAKLYAPESASALKAYLFGLRSLDKVRADRSETEEQRELSESTLDNYRNSLRNLGMSEFQMDEIQRTRQTTSMIEVRATEAGFILARNVTLGQRFERGSELFQIADLSRVWILADVFGREASQFKAGTKVQVSLPDRDLALQARVSHVLPQFDPATRTMKVRLEVENPGYLLRPDMFVDVQTSFSLPNAIMVPADAVVNTGLHRRVFLDRGNGLFEPRDVKTGNRINDRIEILEGISMGDRIIVAGTFLVDSESRMQLAASGLPVDYAVDPVCKMGVNPRKTAVLESIYQGSSYYFCSASCKEKFDNNPSYYFEH